MIVGGHDLRQLVLHMHAMIVTPQCYGCTKTLASHEHEHHHLIHKHHTIMNVIIACVFLFELLGFMLAIVCAHVWSMQMCVKCTLKQLSYT